jgi:hypothetical protein
MEEAEGDGKRMGEVNADSTDLSILIAQRLRMLAVQSRTSNEIQISQKIQPKIHEPFFIMFAMFSTGEK